MVLIITSRPTSFSCHSWCTNKNYFSPAVTVRIVTSVHPNAGRFLSFVYILQTTWMSNKEKPVENPNRGRKKQNDVDVVVITIIAIKREKRCRISVYFAVRETVWYVSMYLLVDCILLTTWVIDKQFSTGSQIKKIFINETRPHLLYLIPPFFVSHKPARTVRLWSQNLL